MKKSKIIGGIVFLVLSVFVVVFFYVQNELKPIQSNKEIIFEVKENATVKTVLQRLQKEGIIKNGEISYLAYKFTNQKPIVFGKFKVSSNETSEVILNRLADSKSMIHDNVKVTLIEGKWSKDFALNLSEKLGIPAQSFLDKWNDRSYIESLKNKYTFITDEIYKNEKVLLEGYLAPDTYFFNIDATVEAVTEKILDNTNQRLSNLQISNYHDLLTRASLLQHEASKKEDMQKIAHIIQSRLDKNMKLGLSVTVCYSLYENYTDWKQCETEIENQSNYNTYVHQGLPPGPINNPSLIAIESVLNPIENENLFFIADVCGDNKIYYSTTYEEHEQKIDKYLRSTACLP